MAIVRFAKEEELSEVNELRRQVNDLHVEGCPDIFKPGFSEGMKDYIFDIWDDEAQQIVVAEEEGKICGFAVLHVIDRPENPVMFRRYYLNIDEFCVDRDYRRRGIAGQMISFIRDYAKEQGFKKLELNMWEFNEGALAFYEAVGFKTYRRFMDMDL